MSLTEISNDIDLAEGQRTVDDLLGDRYRVEVVDGALVVTPAAGWSHNAVVADLLFWFRARVPVGLLAVAEVDVSVDSTGTSREPYWRPDIVVSAGPVDHRRPWLLAGEVELAVEVISPSDIAQSGSTERYLRQRAGHGARHGLRWLLGVDGDRVSWWHDGQPVAAGPDWTAGLRVVGGRVVLD